MVAPAVKLLVFAHTPPPLHGQSYMVKVLLDGLADAEARHGAGPEGPRITCLHVNARYSTDLQDIGHFRFAKVLALFGHCAHALALRLRHGVRTLYLVPSPPRRAPLVRDLVTLLLLRPFFPRVIFHWHAGGLGTWLRTEPAWLRLPARALFGRADLSVVLAASSEQDARVLAPKRVVVVHYGIADAFPDFATRLGLRRAERTRTIALALAPATASAPIRELRIRVLFIAMCTREKGLFDALAAVAAANDALARGGSDVRFELHVAGDFRDPAERTEIESLVATPPWRGLWHYHGFVSGEPKQRLFEDADLMIFPTFYAAESFPVVVLEAMSAGLPVLATRHRAIPEMLPEDYPGLVDAHDVAGLAAKLPELARSEIGLCLRQHCLERFTLDRYVTRMTEVMAEVAA